MFRILFVTLWFLLHPVHVTLTSIDYVPESVSFKVFVRMYFDDFLADCRLNGGEIQDDSFSVKSRDAVKTLEKYLGDKVVLKVNENHLTAELKEFNIVDNEISINLEYSYVKKPEYIVVKNLIMTGLYPDQSNMVIIRINDFEEGVKLTSEITEKKFIIN